MNWTKQLAHLIIQICEQRIHQIHRCNSHFSRFERHTSSDPKLIQPEMNKKAAWSNKSCTHTKRRSISRKWNKQGFRLSIKHKDQYRDWNQQSFVAILAPRGVDPSITTSSMIRWWRNYTRQIDQRLIRSNLQIETTDSSLWGIDLRKLVAELLLQKERE